MSEKKRLEISDEALNGVSGGQGFELPDENDIAATFPQGYENGNEKNVVYTDALDEVLLKVIHSKQKKLKVIYREV